MTGHEGTEITSPPAPAPDEVALDQLFDRDGLYSLRAAVAAHATDLGLPEADLGGFQLAATELATNAIRHGGGGGRLRLWRTGETLHLQVSDDGPGMADPHAAGTRPAPLTAANGRGLWILRQLCTRVHIAAATAGTVVTASLDLQPGAPRQTTPRKIG
jgi:anti-sigma regulatory factor (Ser/Thr protein kinase)